jgi:hypothetical protein
MGKKQDILNQYTSSGFEMLYDDGKGFTFRKNFNMLAFILLLLFTFFGGIIYLIYHFSKKKIYIKYK